MEKAEFRHLVRVANTDLKGEKPIASALRRIKGINTNLANAVLSISKVDKTKRTGELTDEEVKKITEIIRNPLSFGIPTWMFNRRGDYESGDDKHLIGSDLDFTKENDIKIMKKIRSYKGIRHGRGLPVRGQRTKGHFRKGKSLGVSKKKGKGGRV